MRRALLVVLMPQKRAKQQEMGNYCYSLVAIFEKIFLCAISRAKAFSPTRTYISSRKVRAWLWMIFDTDDDDDVQTHWPQISPSNKRKSTATPIATAATTTASKKSDTRTVQGHLLCGSVWTIEEPLLLLLLDVNTKQYNEACEISTKAESGTSHNWTQEWNCGARDGRRGRCHHELSFEKGKSDSVRR